MKPAAVYEEFRRFVHSSVPESHTIDLDRRPVKRRGLCGEHGRVVPTRQDLCPRCAGYLEPAA